MSSFFQSWSLLDLTDSWIPACTPTHKCVPWIDWRTFFCFLFLQGKLGVKHPAYHFIMSRLCLPLGNPESGDFLPAKWCRWTRFKYLRQNLHCVWAFPDVFCSSESQYACPAFSTASWCLQGIPSFLFLGFIHSLLQPKYDFWILCQKPD